MQSMYIECELHVYQSIQLHAHQSIRFKCRHSFIAYWLGSYSPIEMPMQNRVLYPLYASYCMYMYYTIVLFWDFAGILFKPSDIIDQS